MTSEKNNYSLPLSRFLSDYRLVLASKSPRRQELLRQLGLDFELRTKDTDEIIPPGLPPQEVPLYLARLKAAAFDGELGPNEVLLTADTVVICQGQILNKPENEQHAFEMLSLLSGQYHEVVTGIAFTSTEKQLQTSDTTRVFFRRLSPQEINYYIQHYRPFDKAGAYGIQEWIGMTAIEKIEGSYFNVVGLPVHKVYEALSLF